MEDNPNAQKHKNNTLLSSLMDLSMIVKEEAEKDKFVLMQIRKQALDRQIAGHEATITSHDGEQARLNIKFRALAKRYEAASRDYKVNENLLKKHQRVLKKGEGDLKAIVERINTKQLIDVEKCKEDLKAEIEERKRTIEDNREKSRKFHKKTFRSRK